MSETFNALTGSLFAVYNTDLDYNIDYVDALLWISEDETETYYIVGSEIVDGSSEEFIDSKMYKIPDSGKEEVIQTMMDFEGNRPTNFYETLMLNDILSIISK